MCSGRWGNWMPSHGEVRSRRGQRDRDVGNGRPRVRSRTNPELTWTPDLRRHPPPKAPLSGHAMSEYAYYEFQAIDRPLSREEIQTLRGCSTRARSRSLPSPTSTRSGSFKGDTDKWMAKYFDAFVHVANWGTRLLMFRLPVRLLTVETVLQYAPGAGEIQRSADDLHPGRRRRRSILFPRGREMG